MQLTLTQLIPQPLRDKLSMRPSGIWNCDLVFGVGEYVFVKAPSGTGKTTLMHILYGLRSDYDGAIRWGKLALREMTAESLAELRANQLSIVFQDMRLFPELTAWENLEIKRQLTNTISAKEMEGWLSRLGISDKRDSLARTLSYGEQQRVAIIRALLQPFKWLLMDEPFSHLDLENIDKARALIIEVIQKNNAGMILADLDEHTFFNYSQTINL